VILAPFEGPGYEERVPYAAVFDCVMEAIGVGLGISGMVSNFVTLWNEGASISTVFGVVKNIFRTYVGWFMVGWAVYKFGGCIGWW
jgi:hypothetical protein